VTPRSFGGIEGITDEETPPFRERRTFRNWRRIGTITFNRAVVSYNGDFVIHFRHPTWRDDQNDPATPRASTDERS
jgi:hypothetical protein